MHTGDCGLSQRFPGATVWPPKAALCSHLSHGSAVMHRRCGELVGMSLLLRVSLLSLLSQPPAQLQLSLMRVLISVAK